MNNKKILVIAAHPDDELIGCGGSIIKFLKAGSAVRILFLAEGVTARYPEHKIHSKKALEEIEIRERNSLKALKFVGLTKKIFISIDILVAGWILFLL